MLFGAIRSKLYPQTAKLALQLVLLLALLFPVAVFHLWPSAGVSIVTGVDWPCAAPGASLRAGHPQASDNFVISSSSLGVKPQATNPYRASYFGIRGYSQAMLGNRGCSLANCAFRDCMAKHVVFRDLFTSKIPNLEEDPSQTIFRKHFTGLFGVRTSFNTSECRH